MIYFDTAYLAKCYLSEPGSNQVRELASSANVISCSDIGRAELSAVFHRHFREGHLNKKEHNILHQQLRQDLKGGIWHWLPVDKRIWSLIEECFSSLGSNVFLRGADAIHLATAQLHGISEIYTNDRHLLKACGAFGIRGVNIVEKETQ